MPANPQPTRSSFGPFEVLTQLAKGGMAATYLARVAGDAPGRELVVKRILPEIATSSEFRELFAAEARVAVRLDHQNVVHTLGQGEIDGELFLALEYVWGSDLQGVAGAARAAGTRLPSPLVAHVVARAAEGLHYAHEFTTPEGDPLHMVHRDVSPPNLMVSFDGKVVVVDFGIAKVARQFQRARVGQLKGKFAYMSPEQVQGRDVDRRSDVFSLGIILYEFTLLRRLFRAESDIATAAAISHAEIERPSAVDPNFDPDLESIILRALAADPADRYPCAADLAADLDAWTSTQEGGDRETLTHFMRSTHGDRMRALEGYLGSDYQGPLGLPDLPDLPEAPEAPEAPEVPSADSPAPDLDGAHPGNDDEPGSKDTEPPAEPLTPQRNDVADSVVHRDHDLPRDPERLPSPDIQKPARQIALVFAGILVVVLAIIGWRLSQEGLGTSYFDDAPVAPSTADLPPIERAEPRPPPRVMTRVSSEPAGAAIIVNGFVTGSLTPSEVGLVSDAENLVSLHLDGYQAELVRSPGGADVQSLLRRVPASQDQGEREPAEETGGDDEMPEPGEGRFRVVVRNTTDQPIPAEVVLNGESVGTAPLRINVPARVLHHVSARTEGMRPSATYAQAIPWSGPNSEHVVELELTADAAGANRWTTLRLETVPTEADVMIDGEPGPRAGLINLDSPLHHTVEITAPDHEPMFRAVDGRLGQFVLTAVLDRVRTDPTLLTVEIDPPETLVFAERIRHGSAGGRQLSTPVRELEVESGAWKLTFESRESGTRVRSRVEVELAAGVHHRLRYEIVDGAFVELERSSEQTVPPQ